MIWINSGKLFAYDLYGWIIFKLFSLVSHVLCVRLVVVTCVYSFSIHVHVYSSVMCTCLVVV